MKKIIKITVLCLISMLAVTIFAACQQKHTLTGIEIKTNPREQYYVGDLGPNLVGGVIILKYADKVNEELEMTNDEVRVTGFNSSEPNASQKLTVTYKSKTASFNVVIKEDHVDKVEVTSFTSSYFTSDTSVVVNNIKVTYESGKTAVVNFDPATMTLSGFNPSAVQEQTISLTYQGKIGTFKVKVIGPDNITPLLGQIAQLNELNWTSDVPLKEAIEKDLYDVAVEAFNTYVGFNADYLKLITLAKMRPAIALVFMSYYNEYLAEKNATSSYFSKDDGSFIYGSIEEMEDFVELADEVLIKINAINAKFSAYSNSEMETGVRLSNYLNDLNDDYTMFDFYIRGLNGAFDLLDMLKDIPSDPEDIDDYGPEITAVFDLILSGDNTMWFQFDLVSTWLDDFDDIVYCLNWSLVSDDIFNDDDYLKMSALAQLALPKFVRDLQAILYTALTEVEYYMSYSLRRDTVFFMLDFREANEMIDEMYANEDLVSTLIFNYVALYDFFADADGNPTGVTLYEVLLRLKTYYYNDWFSYYWFMDRMIGDRIFNDFFEYYLDVASRYLNEGEAYYTSDYFTSEADVLFRRFINLSPVHQFQFFMAIDTYYKLSFNSSYGISRFYIVENVNLVFVHMLSRYHVNIESSTEEMALSKQLMRALVNYAEWKAGKDSSSSYFTTQMETCITAHTLMETKPDPDSLLGQLYAKYLEIYRVVKNGKTSALGEWEADFEQLEYYIKEMEIAYYARFSNSPNLPYHMFFFSAYFNAIEIAERILTEAPDEIVNAYYNDYRHTVSYIGSGTTSLGYMMYYFQNAYVFFMKLDYGLSNYGLDLWDFLTPDLQEFIALSHHAYWTLESDNQKYNDTIMKNINTQFRELTIEEQFNFLFMFDGWFGYQYYYSAIRQYYSSNLKLSAEYNAAMKLFYAESYYVYYAMEKDEEDLEEFLTLMKECIDLYESLLDTTNFDSYLEEMYQYYLDLYEELKPYETVTPETLEEGAQAA